MDSVTETMARIERLFEKHAPGLMREPGMAFGVTKAQDHCSPVYYSPEQRAQVEALLKSGRSPLQVSNETGVHYSAVLRWSLKLGLRWKRGRKEPLA